MCKNRDMIARLCGDKAAGGMRLVTTMWDKTRNGEIVERRALQLEQHFWRPLIEAGARHKRFEDNSPRCAWGIIKDLMGGGEAILFQEELVDIAGKLNETTAGKALYTELQKLLHEQKETVELLQEAKARRDAEWVEQLEAEQRRLKGELQKTWDKMSKWMIQFDNNLADRGRVCC